MEAKYKAYKSFDWSLNEKWQMHLNNIFPLPPAARLEKIRRKWYKDNVDKEFDLNYEPSSESSSNANNRGGQQAGAGPQANNYQ